MNTKIATTDLEQIEQFQRFYTQAGAGLVQIEALKKRIYLAELAAEQAAAGVEAEDVNNLRSQLILVLQSLRRRSAKYLEDLVDISGRAKKKTPQTPKVEVVEHIEEVVAEVVPANNVAVDPDEEKDFVFTN